MPRDIQPEYLVALQRQAIDMLGERWREQLDKARDEMIEKKIPITVYDALRYARDVIAPRERGYDA